MINKTGFAIGLSAMLLVTSTAVFAASKTTTIGVSARVSKTCSISTSGGGIAFGDYDPIGTNATAPLYANGSVSVTCSKGSTGVTIGMDLGQQPLAGQRQMKGVTGTTPLSYSIFQPPSSIPGAACTNPGTIPWTATGAGLLTLDAALSKESRTYNVCGVIPGNQDVTVEAYSDVVTATLNF